MTPFTRWVDNFFSDDDQDLRTWRKEWEQMPAVNVREKDNAYLIEVAAPGFDKSDFKVSLEDGVMTIRAEKKAESEDKAKDYIRKEFSYSSFERRFTLPDGVENDQVKAEFKNGVLHIDVPRKAVEVKKPGKEVPVS